MIGIALKLLGWGKALAGAAWALALRYPWQIACLALLALAAWCWQGWTAEQAARARDARLWQDANRINRQSIAVLTGAITRQTEAVNGWAREAERRQKAAQDALRKAEKRGEALEALAVRIERERAPRGATGKCETPRAVLDARGEL